LNAVDEETLGQAITLAWQNLATKKAAPRRVTKTKRTR
jgi:hypothetical protein